MSLAADKCPECGARVQVESEVLEARCEYCQATFRVALGRVAPGQGASARAEALDERPTRRRSAVRAVLAFVVLVALLAAGLVVVMLGVPGTPAGDPGDAPGSPVAEAGGTAESTAQAEDPPSWLPHRQAILADVNGDGLRDPIGWARYYRQPGTPQHLVALDAASGARLWQSDAFPPENWSDIRVAYLEDPTGGRLIVGDAAGLVRAIAVENGRTVWSVPLGERVERACRRTEGGLLLYLKDKRAVEVRLTTGALTPRGQGDVGGASCEPLATGERGQSPGLSFDAPPFGLPHRVEIDGVQTGHVLQADGSRLAFALGVRRPGTALPTVAAFDPRERPVEAHAYAKYTAVWRTDVAGTTPLSAAEGAPEVAWFADDRLYVPYAVSGAAPAERLICLDAASGRILYDVVLRDVEPGRATGLAGADGRLYVTHSQGLDVFDARTGAPLLHLSD